MDKEVAGLKEMGRVGEEISFPEKIQTFVSGKPYTAEDIGMSGSKVLMFEDMVLKIEKAGEAFDRMVTVMQWLQGKLPVPEILAYEEANGMNYLLMGRITGKMSCDIYYLEHPEEMVALLAQGLKLLWAVDISDCPYRRDLETELSEAKERVEKGEVDVDNAEPDTFGTDGFANPMELFDWLEANKPIMEPVFSHGDYCLPNVFLKDGKVSGFIDLGDAGIGDKWRDIALCYRSLKHNFDGAYGGKVYENFNPDILFEKLGIEPDWEKLRYYILLDELF